MSLGQTGKVLYVNKNWNNYLNKISSRDWSKWADIALGIVGGMVVSFLLSLDLSVYSNGGESQNEFHQLKLPLAYFQEYKKYTTETSYIFFAISKNTSRSKKENKDCLLWQEKTNVHLDEYKKPWIHLNLDQMSLLLPYLRDKKVGVIEEDMIKKHGLNKCESKPKVIYGNI